MDSHTSDSETVNAAESLLSSSPGAASTGSRERMDSDSSDRYVNSEQRTRQLPSPFLALKKKYVLCELIKRFTVIDGVSTKLLFGWLLGY